MDSQTKPMSEIRPLISKINDRNIQRKRESGFTTYALLSVVIVVVYHVFTIFPTIEFYKDTNVKIIVFSILSNICLYSLFIIKMFSNIDAITIKIFRTNPKKPIHLNIILYFIIFFTIGIFFYSLFLKQFYLIVNFPIYVAVIIVFNSLLLAALIKNIKKRVENKTKLLHSKSSGIDQKYFLGVVYFLIIIIISIGCILLI